MQRRWTRAAKTPEAADDESRIRSVALALQTYREHGAKELTNKLSRKGYDQPTVAQVVDGLRESGLVSDKRFAEAFVRAHAGRGHGPIRIQYELRELGVSGELIRTALDESEVDWHRLAVDIRVRKFGENAPNEYAVRAKQMRFLQYRGFSTDHIRAAFAAHSHDADELPEFDPDS